MIEEWRYVPGYPHHEVSNFGVVRVLAYSSINKIGVSIRYPGRTLKQSIAKGYYTVHIYRKSDGIKMWRTNRMVCEVFNGAPPTADHEADHIDNVRWNNRSDNLQWLTFAENQAKKIPLSGERNPRARITEKIAADMRRRSISPTTDRLIGDEYGLPEWIVKCVRLGYTWKNISTETP